jgi:hypothetical protein
VLKRRIVTVVVGERREMPGIARASVQGLSSAEPAFVEIE